VAKKQVKIYNKNPFDVGIRLHNWARGRKIRGIDPLTGKVSFIFLTEDETLELHSMCNMFIDGTLTVEDVEVKELLGLTEDNYNAYSEEEIQKVLKLAPSKLKKEIKNFTEPFAKDKVYQTALKMDLTAARIKIVEEFCGKKLNYSKVKDK